MVAYVPVASWAASGLAIVRSNRDIVRVGLIRMAPITSLPTSTTLECPNHTTKPACSTSMGLPTKAFWHTRVAQLRNNPQHSLHTCLK
eukprot:1162100-Pelagomonas_calceolata.AAC.7